jgi:hypothetical protein
MEETGRKIVGREKGKWGKRGLSRSIFVKRRRER